MDQAPFKYLLIAAAVLLMAMGLLGGTAPERGVRPGGPTDLGLYADSLKAAGHPSAYYATIVAEERAQGYPLHPFIGMRPPVLAFLLAALPGEAARRIALGALALGVLAAWAARLKPLLPPLGLALALVALATGVLPALTPQAYLMHETWAGLLIALSLALRRPDAFAASVAAGLAAALIRELAAPYLMVMLVMALHDGRRREAGAWLGALGLFAAALGLHGWMVNLHTLPTDLRQGWVQMGGWPFVLHAAQWNAVLAAGPAWLAAVLTPLALIGAAAWGGPLGARLGLTVAGYVGGLLLIGRPEDGYWGLMIAPLLPLGLVMAPKLLFRPPRRPEADAGPPAWAEAR